MTIDMSKDDFLGLLQAISEGISTAIKNYRATNGCAAAAPENAPEAATEKPEKKEEPLTVLNMTAKVLKKSPIPLGKDEIIRLAQERFGIAINKTSLSVALNHAIKKHKKIKRVSHGKYTNIGRKTGVKEAKAGKTAEA